MFGGSKTVKAGSRTQVKRKPATKKTGSGTRTIAKQKPAKKPQSRQQQFQGSLKGAARSLGGVLVPGADSDVFDSPTGDQLWYPYATRPSWLDGSLPGDRGFDPLECSKPTDYVEIGPDESNVKDPSQTIGAEPGNISPKKAMSIVGGETLGKWKPKVAEEEQTSALRPYEDQFDLLRLRECEVIHGRWAMLAIVGIPIAELVTGVSWRNAGLVEMEQVQYANKEFDLSLKTITFIEILLMGAIEVYRNQSREFEERVYPGGFFDPLNLSSDPAAAFNLRTAEVKHSRLAMVGMLYVFTKGLFAQQGALVP